MEGVIRHWMNFGKFEMLDKVWYVLERLEEFLIYINWILDELWQVSEILDKVW